MSTAAVDFLAAAGTQARADDAPRRLAFGEHAHKLTHNAFRYPAKFHPPVARALVEMVSRPGDTVLDPFCGSGTTLVEALAAGRNAVGTDVDPLAAFVAGAKVRRHLLPAVDGATARLGEALTRMSEADLALWGPLTQDVPEADFQAAAVELRPWIPDLPRMEHWFRRRVVLQLGAIRRLAEASPDASAFTMLCFASIIRNASNADPVPVSGLEVTSHMRAKEEAGRAIDPYALMSGAMKRTSKAVREFAAASGGGGARVSVADARTLTGAVTGRVDCVVTSPPYLTAVDYYRRHTLEMYWLGLTGTSGDRLELLPRYIGRDRVAANAVNLDACSRGATVARRWRPRFGELKPERHRAFVHYCVGMSQALGRVTSLLPDRGKAVVVVGDVRFAGVEVPMDDLMVELAPDRLFLADRLWYPLVNRYMSYSRKHEADIDSDHVLVFQRCP